MNISKAVEMEFETPHMVIDMDQVRRNILKVQSITSENGKKLRPHSKTHKIPYLAKLQINAGADGICVQKVSEAEVMFNGSIKNILLSNETFGTKFNRVASLIQKGCNLVVAVDNIISLEQFSRACNYFSVEGRVLIDVDVGMNRCGTDPDGFVQLCSAVINSKALLLDGIMAYDGQIHSPNIEKRKSEVNKEETILAPLIGTLKSAGITDPKISVGGTPTWEIWSKSEIPTELQPGTYIYYDTHCLSMGLCSLNEIAIGVVSTVTSEKVGERFVLDAGYKSISLDQGVFPSVFDGDGNQYDVLSMSEEHTVLKSKDNSSKLGKKLIMLPYHSCTTADLWDGTYALSGDLLPVNLAIQGRGKRE